MLHVIIVLCVFLSITQTAPPVPRQTPNGTASTSRKDQDVSKDNNGPASKPLPVVSATNTPTPNQEEANKCGTNRENSVIISKLPAVTVDSPNRDWVDWGTWLFTLFLAAVGGVQAWLLKGQIKLMAGSVHVDGVRTANELAESPMQVFFVTVANSGMTAKHVSITMEVDIAGNTTKYQGGIAMMVPANGTRDFPITSCIGINKELLQRLDGDTLRVRGRITWGKGKKETEDYCYKYNRCPLVPVPEGFPKFVPCDFDTRMAVSVGGRADGKSTATATITSLEKPQDETKT